MKKCHLLDDDDDDVEAHFVVGVVTVWDPPARSSRSFACSRSTSDHSHRRGLLSNRRLNRRFALGRLLYHRRCSFVGWFFLLLFESSSSVVAVGRAEDELDLRTMKVILRWRTSF